MCKCKAVVLRRRARLGEAEGEGGVSFVLTTFVGHDQDRGVGPWSFGVEHLKRDQILGVGLQILYGMTLEQ